MIAKRSVLTDEMVAKIEALAPRYPNRQALTLPALHIVNAELRHVPLEAVAEIAAILGLAPAEVQDTLSFYQFFYPEKPHGTVRAFVCRSISCALRGGDPRPRPRHPQDQQVPQQVALDVLARGASSRQPGELVIDPDE